MESDLVKSFFTTALAAAALTVIGVSSASAGEDTGTVVGRGSGAQCAWMRVLSDTDQVVRAYGVPHGSAVDADVATMIPPKGSHTNVQFDVQPGFVCQGSGSAAHLRYVDDQ